MGNITMSQYPHTDYGGRFGPVPRRRVPKKPVSLDPMLHGRPRPARKAPPKPVSKWLVEGLPRGRSKTIVEFLEFMEENSSVDLFRSILCTLGAFPMSDLKHLEDQDKQYLVTYVYHLWMVFPKFQLHATSSDLTAAEGSMCVTTADVLRLLVAYLQGKTLVNVTGHPAVDKETVPLLSSFQRLHRLGVITTNSQPEILDASLLASHEEVRFEVMPPAGDGKAYVVRQDAYITGAMTSALKEYAVRFVETHSSKRISGCFIHALTKETIRVGLKAKNATKGYRPKRYSPINADGHPTGPWIERHGEEVDQYGMYVHAADGLFGEVYEGGILYTKSLSAVAADALNTEYPWRFKIIAHADAAGAIDLPDELVRYFNDLVPPAQRIVGDAPTLLAYLSAAREELKAAGFADLGDTLKTQKEDYVRQEEGRVTLELIRDKDEMRDQAIESYEDYCADRAIPCIKKSPERIAFIERFVDGFERQRWEWLDANVVSREW
jgi:hypothetical protein